MCLHAPFVPPRRLIDTVASHPSSSDRSLTHLLRRRKKIMSRGLYVKDHTRLRLLDLWKVCDAGINSSNACLEHFYHFVSQKLRKFPRVLSKTNHFRTFNFSLQVQFSSIVTCNVLTILLPFIFMLEFLSFLFKKPQKRMFLG